MLRNSSGDGSRTALAISSPATMATLRPTSIPPLSHGRGWCQARMAAQVRAIVSEAHRTTNAGGDCMAADPTARDPSGITRIGISLHSVQSLLITLWFQGQPLGAVATGLIVMTKAGPALVTNRHNLTGRHQETGQPLASHGGVPDEVRILHNEKGGLGRWIEIPEKLYDANGAPLWREHPVFGAKADIVALLLTDLTDVQLYPYDLMPKPNEMFVGPSDTVNIIGFPFGVAAGGAFAVWVTGFMASEPDVDLNGLPVFFVDCRSRPGQSGSPVIAYRGAGMPVAMPSGGVATFSGPVHRFLGVYCGRINERSDIGIVWKASAVRTLVEAIA